VEVSEIKNALNNNTAMLFTSVKRFAVQDAYSQNFLRRIFSSIFGKIGIRETFLRRIKLNIFRENID
jgi:hypothetical protein